VWTYVLHATVMIRDLQRDDGCTGVQECANILVRHAMRLPSQLFRWLFHETLSMCSCCKLEVRLSCEMPLVLNSGTVARRSTPALALPWHAT